MLFVLTENVPASRPLLSKYPALTVGTGLVLGTFAESCEGAILHTDIDDITLAPGDSLFFDVMHLSNGPYASTSFFYGSSFSLLILNDGNYGVYSNAAPMGYGQPYYNYLQVGSNGYVNQFNKGDTIGPGTTDNINTTNAYLFNPPGGYWSDGVGYMGLMVADTNNDTDFYRFGWARVVFGQEEAIIRVTLTDFAIELEPGVPIKAGQVPEPSSLGLLAMGAAGLAHLRRRRAKASGA